MVEGAGIVDSIRDEGWVMDGDRQLTELNDLLSWDEEGVHTRRDIADEAVAEIKRMRARVAKLEAERERIGIALEWPSQEGDTTLLDAVKEATQFGVLLCESRTRVEALEAAARDVVFEPVGNPHAKCNSEAIMALEALVPDQPVEVDYATAIDMAMNDELGDGG